MAHFAPKDVPYVIDFFLLFSFESTTGSVSAFMGDTAYLMRRTVFVIVQNFFPEERYLFKKTPIIIQCGVIDLELIKP